ncbi:MAG TPA: DNA-binding protein [Spirochaetia bacterium]|nr:DNA-binding protein [Spirochaetia bacterium]
MNEDKYLTTEEVAKILRCPRATVWQYTHRRLIPYYKIGRRNLFRPKDVNNFIESCKRSAV